MPLKERKKKAVFTACLQLNPKLAPLSQKFEPSSTIVISGSNQFVKHSQDVEHNRKSLKAAMQNHRITPKQYEEALGMMEDYSNIPTKRLAYLAKHYISHARMQLMEENINLNRPVCDDIDDVIGRLDQLYSLRKTRYGSAMDKLADEREDLAYLLTKQLDRLEHQSGIFLIKPYIAYKSNTLNVVKKENPFVPPPLMKSTESMMSEEVNL